MKNFKLLCVFLAVTSVVIANEEATTENQGYAFWRYLSGKKTVAGSVNEETADDSVNVSAVNEDNQTSTANQEEAVVEKPTATQPTTVPAVNENNQTSTANQSSYYSSFVDMLGKYVKAANDSVKASAQSANDYVESLEKVLPSVQPSNAVNEKGEKTYLAQVQNTILYPLIHPLKTFIIIGLLSYPAYKAYEEYNQDETAADEKN